MRVSILTYTWIVVLVGARSKQHRPLMSHYWYRSMYRLHLQLARRKRWQWQSRWLRQQQQWQSERLQHLEQPPRHQSEASLIPQMGSSGVLLLLWLSTPRLFVHCHQVGLAWRHNDEADCGLVVSSGCLVTLPAAVLLNGCASRHL